MAWAYVEIEREYGLKTRTVDLIRKAADKLMNGECYILRQIADDPELAREFLNNARYSKKKECPLSPDDLELLRLAANGVSNAKIASSKGFAEQTIKNRFFQRPPGTRCEVADRSRCGRVSIRLDKITLSSKPNPASRWI